MGDAVPGRHGHSHAGDDPTGREAHAGSPGDFVPDLRRLKPWPSMEDSPWRQPYLADLTFGRLFRLVRASVPRRTSRILEVGCGSGYLGLELARLGHDVVGIDLDADALALARRASRADPRASHRGRLSHVTGDFQGWSGGGRRFDIVVFCRSLHHMDPPEALGRARGLLAPGGRVVCVEYAYDQFDRRSATWLYHLRRTLEASGWYTPTQDLPRSERGAIRGIEDEWMGYGREHDLQGYHEMKAPLEHLFHQVHFSWHPYLYWEMISDMRIPAGPTERNFALFLLRTEQHLIRTGRIPAALFRWVGTTEEAG